MAYTHLELISDKRMRVALYITAALAILLSMAQIAEFKPLLKNALPIEQFVDTYINNCPFHAFLCILLILVLVFVRWVILRIGMWVSIWVYIFFICFLWGKAMIWNIDEVIFTVGKVLGIWDGGINWAMIRLYKTIFILIILFSVYLFVVKHYSKKIKHFLQKTSFLRLLFIKDYSERIILFFKKIQWRIR